MVIRNTSAYPTREVSELVELAVDGVDMERVCVNVKGCRAGYGGNAYLGVPEISNAPASAEYLVTLRIAPGRRLGLPIGPLNYNLKRPDQVGPRNRFPFFVLDSWQEVLVKLAAHEARHIHQYRHDLQRSEVDCEYFALEALSRYRGELPLAATG
jgi:hypothetical protein